MGGLIPTKLRKYDFRFIKIKPKAKIPYEYNWQKNNNYIFESEELQRHLDNNGNYGIATGFGNLIVIDCDDAIAENLVEQNLPETFTIQTGSGKKHFYYICNDGKNLKVFKNQEKETLADVQFEGKQVIGSGSIHPNGNPYSVLKDNDISQIDFKQIVFCFGSYLQYSHSIKDKTKRRMGSLEQDRICKEIKEKVTMEDLLSEIGIATNRNPTECPWNASIHGKCFSFTA